ASSGRMFASFAALADPGSSAHSLFRAPLILVAQVANGGLAFGLLVPSALIGCVLAAQKRQWTRVHTGVVFCVPILALMCTDPGADYNHLLDLAVLFVLVAGYLWNALVDGRDSHVGARLGFAAALGWVLL